ncbi:MAG: hypothetical protein KF819_39950 [Labilithrix sp.]|nr:hypothetical protein [Labilithrix sp.]
MHINLGEGHVFSGTALEIIAAMKSIASGVDALTLEEYVDWVIERAATMEDVHIHVARGPLPLRAEALLCGLVAGGLAADLASDEEEDERTTMRWRAAAELTCLAT